MKYSEIKSDYIRGRIAKTAWDDRQYVDDLIRLLRFVTEEPTTASSARLHSVLRQKYPKDWLALCREHSEERYQYELDLCRKAREASETAKAREKSEREAEEAQSREGWEEAGGRP